MACSLLLQPFVLLYSSLFILALSRVSGVNGAEPRCFPPDLHALRAFGAAAIARPTSGIIEIGDYVALTAEGVWKGEDCCSWFGVTCTIMSTATASRVSELVLTDIRFSQDAASRVAGHLLEPLCNLSLLSNLSLNFIAERQGPHLPPGPSITLPACLGNLSNLLKLSLVSLPLTGSIPSSFARLLHLQYLDLSFNPGLSGPLPTITNLSNLTHLYLHDCSLSGPLPPFHTPLLEILFLYGNSLNSTLHDFALLSDLPRLTVLHLSHNSLSGSFPSSIARFSQLQSLQLDHNNLQNNIPQSLCSDGHTPPNCSAAAELEQLAELDLSENQLTGSLPPWIGKLSSLTILDLSSNQFKGAIPNEWQHLQNLSYLNLASSSLLPLPSSASRLPGWLFRLPHLVGLFLGGTGLDAADVHCKTKLSLLNRTLTSLHVPDNNIQGPDILRCFSLHNFTAPNASPFLNLMLANNPLSVDLSEIQFAPVAISSLNLSSCKLRGQFPSRLLDQPSALFGVSLADNNLSGKIPASWGGAGLSELDLANNFFSGFSPCVNCTPSRLSDINLRNNVLVGELAGALQALGTLPTNCSTPSGWLPIHLGSLDLSRNSLQGQIPAALLQCNPYLERMKLNNNLLAGQIPPQLFTPNMTQLQIVALQHNFLEGSISSSIIRNPSLQLLDLSYNWLEGNLESILAQSGSSSPQSTLRGLLLAHNRIHGSIPLSFGTLTPALQLIDLSHNNLTGSIPQDLHLPSFQYKQDDESLASRGAKPLYEEVELAVKGAQLQYQYVLKILTAMDLSGNQLEGAIPSQLGDLVGMRFLNLSHNRLTGRIPEALSNLSLLEDLDLSYNNLQGSIPQELSRLSNLAVFNVSYNEALTGAIPTGAQLGEDPDSYRGDPHLCGKPILKACTMPGDDSHEASSESKPKGALARWIKEWISLPGLSLGIVVGFGGMLFILYGPLYPF